MFLEELLIDLQQEFFADALWGREVFDPAAKVIENAIIIARVKACLYHPLPPHSEFGSLR
jgi:hypothetical protein